jgi:long-subunit acyl-CoA synthetase (AMP-forming)
MVSGCYLPSTLGLEAWQRLGNSFPKSTLAHLPAAHIAGVQSYLINSVYQGSVIYWMPSFNFDDFIRHFAELKVTFFFSVPPIFTAIAKHPAVKDQFKSVEYATAGAAPMSYDLQESASKRLKGVIYQVWGLSETSGAVTYTPPDRTDSMGSLSPLLPTISLRYASVIGAFMENLLLTYSLDWWMKLTMTSRLDNQVKLC